MSSIRGKICGFKADKARVIGHEYGKKSSSVLCDFFCFFSSYDGFMLAGRTRALVPSATVDFTVTDACRSFSYRPERPHHAPSSLWNTTP
jgi:hypothetical protein